MGTILRLCDYDRPIGAYLSREQEESATIIILPTVKVERYDTKEPRRGRKRRSDR